jgi:transposase-like protein
MDRYGLDQRRGRPRIARVEHSTRTESRGSRHFPRPRRGRPESRRGNSSKRYSVATKLARLAGYERSALTRRDVWVQHRVSTATLCKWRRAHERRGERGLEPKSAATWLAENAPGAREGWRWQWSWSGPYAIVIHENEEFDPWAGGAAGQQTHEVVDRLARPNPPLSTNLYAAQYLQVA